MTVTTLEPTLIEHLDPQLCCQVAICNFGRPPATHIVYMTCGCDPLACTGSAEALSQSIQDAMDRFGLQAVGTCMTCGRMVRAADVRIEPLP